METPEKIPVDEAAARDLLPCSVCGATGAGIRQVSGKKHFLCAACEARGRRWSRGAIVALVVVAGAIGVYRWSTRPAGPSDSPPPSIDVRQTQNEVVELIRKGNYAAALPLLRQLVLANPSDSFTGLLMGQCLSNLGYYEKCLVPFQVALKGDPKDEAECRFKLGMALHYLGHSQKALPFLEKKFEGGEYEKSRLQLLTECLVDLERFEDALKILEGRPPDPVILRNRHRALLYMGRPQEARKVYDGADVTPANRAVILALQLREEGDFEGALKLLKEAEPSAGPTSLDLLRLRQAAIQVYLESGDLARVETLASDLAVCTHPITAGEARYYLVLGRLMAGKRDEAVAAAKEFLTTMDIELGHLRMESLIMQHLAGTRITTELLAAEAAQVNRFRANDMFFYLALATGDPQWAKKAAESTPGHNFPYHAIHRLLKK
jgi:tetratricopeptide (TPR) repeat protein